MTVKKNTGIRKNTSRVTPKKPMGVPAGPTSATQWKKSSAAGTPIRVPSGNVALLKRPGMQVFLAQGIIPNSLMSFVNDSLKTGKPKTEDLDLNAQTMKDLMALVDAVTVECCLEPKVHPVPSDPRGNPMIERSRDPELLYVDEVDVEDKMFIFNYAVGGTSDVDSFRKELTITMDNL
jgi:hypothetical protein